MENEGEVVRNKFNEYYLPNQLYFYKGVVDLNKKVEHCESCDVCVEGNDHHCPWTSKCIGKNNLKCFYMFVVMLFVCIFYGMFAVITVAINETKNLRQQK